MARIDVERVNLALFEVRLNAYISQYLLVLPLASFGAACTDTNASLACLGFAKLPCLNNDHFVLPVDVLPLIEGLDSAH